VRPFLSIEDDPEVVVNYGDINAIALMKGKLSNAF
jgi:hypothetical protein